MVTEGFLVRGIFVCVLFGGMVLSNTAGMAQTPQVNKLSVGWRGGYALPAQTEELRSAHGMLEQRLAGISEKLAAELPPVEELAWLWRGFQINRAGFIPLDPEASDPEPGDLEDVAWCDGRQRQIYRFRYEETWVLVEQHRFKVLDCTPLAEVSRQISQDLQL